GSPWVGWRNVTGSSGPVEITFEFDDVRNFSEVSLQMSNKFSDGVKVFSHARVFFGVGGRYYNTNPLTVFYAPDDILEHPRFVKIKLRNRIGKFVKLQLFYAADWMMISEVTFVSEIVEGERPDEEEPILSSLDYDNGETDHISVFHSNNNNNNNNPGKSGGNPPNRSTAETGSKEDASERMNSGRALVNNGGGDETAATEPQDHTYNPQ
ncbi:unnamed protein product, partial [Notodromas monacha]